MKNYFPTILVTRGRNNHPAYDIPGIYLRTSGVPRSFPRFAFEGNLPSTGSCRCCEQDVYFTLWDQTLYYNY